MFDGIIDWLNSLSQADKQKLIDNLKNFRALQTLLEAKGVLIKDPENGDFVITKNHSQVGAFLEIFGNLKMKGVKVRDERKK